MQLPTQEQFVKDCLAKYWFSEIPSDQKWEVAHFPLPASSGEQDTVMLWSADHTVQGLLQSVELNYKCFHHKANNTDLSNLETYYPEYLELFAQLKLEFNSWAGKKAFELGTGVFAIPTVQRTAISKKAGIKNAELGLGVHTFKVRSAGGKEGSATTNAQKYKCLITGTISTPGPLARYQRARGIDTKLRVKLVIQSLSS
jgi:hypothetical protein